MSDTPRRERRSPMVMLLDAAMRLAVSAQAGPKPRLEVPGSPATRRRLADAGRGGRADRGGWCRGHHRGAAQRPGRTLLAGPARADPGTGAVGAGVPGGDREPVQLADTRAPATSTSPALGSRAAPRPVAPPPAAVPLTARYSAAEGGLGLLGYTAEVTIANPGAAGREGWRMTLTLPRPTLRVAQVSGAVASQDGSTWTFEPDQTTRSVAAGGSVRISFQVHGATLLTAAPRDCQIDDRPCTGVGTAAAPSG